MVEFLVCSTWQQGTWPLSNIITRREEIILCRLRIGHSYLTHRFFKAGEDPPECSSCQECLTISYIMVGCSEYIHIRQRYYDVENLHELLDNVCPQLIIHFMKAAGLFLFILFTCVTVENESSHHSFQSLARFYISTF